MRRFSVIVYGTAATKRPAPGKMMLTRRLIPAIALAASTLLAGQLASGQTPPSLATGHSLPLAPQNLPLENQSKLLLAITPRVSSPLQPLLDFRDSDIKFNLGELMGNLRDTRHEGWVLAAYPDPKTSRPLIGAGFSLDVPVREHPQSDPLNPTPFLEPSSAQLWQAAGLDSQKLQAILNQFDEDLAAWTKRNFQRKIQTHDLTPQLTEDEATQLLRISAIQAVHNARAYCRQFNQLTGYQQMALSQLVFQMGVNLEEFTHFLGAINDDPAYRDASLLPGETETDAQHWKNVQNMLIQSDWARRYSTRAVAVIAMFDPDYASDPSAAEHKVRVQVHPYHHKRRAATVKTASVTHKKSSTHRTHQS
ncbi:MAG: hypothetical protein ABR902_20035 [Candidatus Korobacteraceae bacterium]|jgi:hypothetical protein